MKLALIDNYDSFTYNLKALLNEQGAEIDVFRNDKLKLDELQKYDGIVFSPGPGLPQDAGMLMELVQYYHTSKPILGICLGMQAIGLSFGAELVNMDKALHGMSLPVQHFGDEIFKDVSNEFEAARYHSWALSSRSFPEELKIIASSENDTIMGIRHIDYPIYGFQFHPESILTKQGSLLVKNFMNQVKTNQHESIDREVI